MQLRWAAQLPTVVRNGSFAVTEHQGPERMLQGAIALHPDVLNTIQELGAVLAGVYASRDARVAKEIAPGHPSVQLAHKSDRRDGTVS